MEINPTCFYTPLGGELFTIGKPARGTWVLLEHPESLEDAAKWNLRNMAIAHLTNKDTQNPKTFPDGKEQFAKLQESAKQQIQTLTTRVNRDHAVAIAEIQSELIEVKFIVNTSLIQSSFCKIRIVE